MTEAPWTVRRSRYDRLKINLFWPSTALVFIVLLVVALGAGEIIRQFDRVANQRESALLANGIAQRQKEVDQMVVPQTVWDDAVVHLDNRFDPSWAEANIGRYLAQTFGFDDSVIYNAGDKPIQAARDGRPTSVSSQKDLIAAAAPLIAEVREAERKRGPLRKPVSGNMVTVPIQADAVSRLNGRFEIITATLVAPDFGTAMPKSGRSSVVVTGMIIDEEHLTTLARRFMTGPILIAQAHAAIPDNNNRVWLRDRDGRQIGQLYWLQRNPGMTLLHNLILPTLVVVATLAVAALLLIRRNQRLANRIMESEARATRLAYFDPATGLPNRAHLYEKIECEISQLGTDKSCGLAIHCIDLDRFNEVNEFLGQHAGDQLIAEAARRLAARCSTRAFMARLSGDEFAVVQPDATREQAAMLADELCDAMRAAIELETGQIFAGCSVGVTLLMQPTITRSEGLRQADLALHRAKEDGGGSFHFFEEEMDTALKLRRMLEADLRDAIATDALFMVYQPQINRNGHMIGVEALMRWHHPERGMMSPSVFIGIAEQCGLIGELGRLAFRHVFDDARGWGPLKVAINVSARQLAAPDFIEMLRSLVAQCRVDPANFELEITEGVLLREDPIVLDTLATLRKMGFTLALDDFGTGYSALSYLGNYPIDKIKIDRSFVVNLGHDRQAEAVVAAIVKLARALRLSVVAEGVETAEQRARLAAVGCSNIQGFLVGMPASAKDIDALMHHSVAA